jgi:hypothetical protein
MPARNAVAADDEASPEADHSSLEQRLPYIIQVIIFDNTATVRAELPIRGEAPVTTTRAALLCH